MELKLERSRIYFDGDLYRGSDRYYYGVRYVDLMTIRNNSFIMDGERIEYFFENMSLKYYGISSKKYHGIGSGGKTRAKKVLGLGKKHFEDVLI